VGNRFGLDPALFFAVWTMNAAELGESDFASPLFLDGPAESPAESLAQGVSGQVNLIEMRYLIALHLILLLKHLILLLKGLNFRRSLSGLLEVMLDFFHEFCFGRVHAIVFKWSPGHQQSAHLNARTRKTPIALSTDSWAAAIPVMHSVFANWGKAACRVVGRSRTLWGPKSRHLGISTDVMPRCALGFPWNSGRFHRIHLI
jgi:hypothetical protein